MTLTQRFNAPETPSQYSGVASTSALAGSTRSSTSCS
jgi:hypothetical protein